MIGLKELVRRRVGDNWRVGVVVGRQGIGKTTAAKDAWEPPQMWHGGMNFGDGEVSVFEELPPKKEVMRIRDLGYRAPYARERRRVKMVFVVNSWNDEFAVDWVIEMPKMVLTVPAEATEKA